MKTSDKGLIALAIHEGIAPAPYLDSVNVWTFGVGHTAAAGAPDPAKMKRGMPADMDAALAQALALFRKDLAAYEAAVNRAVKVPVRQHEFDALVSFHYNTGGIGRAALVRSLNSGDRSAAAKGFMNWKKPAAIIGRRKQEKALFQSGIYPAGGIPIWNVGASNRPGRVIRTLTHAEFLRMLRPEPTPALTVTDRKPEPEPEPEPRGWFAALLGLLTGART